MIAEKILAAPIQGLGIRVEQRPQPISIGRIIIVIIGQLRIMSELDFVVQLSGRLGLQFQLQARAKCRHLVPDKLAGTLHAWIIIRVFQADSARRNRLDFGGHHSGEGGIEWIGRQIRLASPGSRRIRPIQRSVGRHGIALQVCSKGFIEDFGAVDRMGNRPPQILVLKSPRPMIDGQEINPSIGQGLDRNSFRRP